MSSQSPIQGHPRFKRLSDYLASKAPPGKLPGRQHIDPSEIADLLPYIMLVDVIPQKAGGVRYKIRLMGSEVAEIQGEDASGKYVSEVLTSPEGKDIIRGYEELRHTRQPNYRRGVVATPGREHILYERVAFPLAKDGENVDMLMFVFVTNKQSR